MFLDIPVCVWCSKIKQNAWLFFLLVSLKAIGSAKIFFFLCGNANSWTLLLRMKKKEKKELKIQKMKGALWLGCRRLFQIPAVTLK